MSTTDPPMGTHHTAGILPSINDAMAIAVLLATYMVRIAATGPGVDAPWFLYVTTDMLIPMLAAIWLFAAATYTVVRRLR